MFVALLKAIRCRTLVYLVVEFKGGAQRWMRRTLVIRNLKIIPKEWARYCDVLMSSKCYNGYRHVLHYHIKLPSMIHIRDDTFLFAQVALFKCFEAFAFCDSVCVG